MAFSAVVGMLHLSILSVEQGEDR
jgi:hypothetical protein